MPGVDATKKSAAAETVGAACDALNNILCFAPIFAGRRRRGAESPTLEPRRRPC